MINIKTSQEKISNCNACGALNFESEFSDKKVDNLTEITIGQGLNQKISLCDDCLKQLLKQIIDYMYPTHGSIIDGDILKSALLQMWLDKKPCPSTTGGIMGLVNSIPSIVEPYI